MDRKVFGLLAVLAGLVLAFGMPFIFSQEAALAYPIPPEIPAANNHPNVSSQPGVPQLTSSERLIAAFFSDPESLDPALDYGTSEHVLIQVYDPLLILKQQTTNEFVPMLATGWTISPDKRTYTFNIRPGVKFHNGNALTASDVAYTFQRGILQGGLSSPQWLFSEPILGSGILDVCDLAYSGTCGNRAAMQYWQAAHPAEAAAICTNLSSAISASNSNGTVTFHLAQAWGPFLHTLAGSWGSVIDREWAIQNGAWDGNCSTWQNYYAATSANSPLRQIVNGTGPFKLDHWTPDEEIILKRNPDYWNKSPLWDQGPFGLAAFEVVSMTRVASYADAADMLLDSKADLAPASSAYYVFLDTDTFFEFGETEGISPTINDSLGRLYRFEGLASTSFDAFFTHNIVPSSQRNYIGSGGWDGHGIPANFFDDLHVRKGFNYAFNWVSYNSSIYGGEAIQRRGPIIKPLVGYHDSQPVYSKNQTLALSELNQAWGGLVATHGFSFTLPYSSGSAARQLFAETLKANIEALDSRFHIKLLSLPISTYSSDYMAKHLPIFLIGWIQDFPHPHGWVSPYLVYFTEYQNLSPIKSSFYQTLVNQCVALSGEAAKACYEGIQNQTYQDALDIFLLQGPRQTYTSARVHGYSLNNGLQNTRFYELCKSLFPVSMGIYPTISQTLPLGIRQGVSAAINIPAEAINQDLRFAVIPQCQAYAHPENALLSDIAFDMYTFLLDGSLVSQQTFNKPVRVSLKFSSTMFPSSQESKLQLLRYEGGLWTDAACGAYERDLVNHTLNAPICRLSRFAVGELVMKSIFLPLVRK